MEPLKIALLQIAPCDSLSENLKKGMGACRKAREMGADIALFPEMFSNGYRIYGRPVEEWQAEAIPADGEFVGAFGKLAKELNMAIGITLLERYDGDPRNALVLFDRFGERRLSYSKVHTCDFDVERNLTPGEDFYVTELDTACGPVKVGAMICYDREFPESARILMLKGAELILTPNACPMEIRLQRIRRGGLSSGSGRIAGHLHSSGGRRGGDLYRPVGSGAASGLSRLRGSWERLAASEKIRAAGGGENRSAVYPGGIPGMSEKRP